MFVYIFFRRVEKAGRDHRESKDLADILARRDLKDWTDSLVRRESEDLRVSPAGQDPPVFQAPRVEPDKKEPRETLGLSEEPENLEREDWTDLRVQWDLGGLQENAESRFLLVMIDQS